METDSMSKEEILQIVENMRQCFSFPSQTMLQIKTYEQEHTRLMLNSFSVHIQIFEGGYELLIDLTKTINFINKPIWPDHRTIQFLLLKNCLYPLYSSFDRLLKGFYDDSVILLRTTYEAFIKILFLSYFPTPRDAIFVKRKGQRNFNLTSFLSDTLKVDWQFIYSVSSSYAHSYSFQTLDEAIQINQNKQTDIICFKLIFDKDKASIPMNLQTFLLWGLIRFSKLLFFTCNQQTFKPEGEKKIAATEEALGTLIRTSKNKMATTYNDINRIYQYVKEKELTD